ncbi:hypothetical protein LXA43DRAFT_898709 [Ganoderma leucocontextum]|nr:hypothetical protein LXA43DRAFT_898709 [Ganoderma leucocontextum]
MLARRLRAFVSHVADVISISALLLKYPIASLVAVTVTVFLMLGAKTLVVHALQSSPSLCNLPVFAHLPFCNVATSSHESSVIERADFPSLIKIQNVVLNDLMDQVAAGASLALNVKHVELAVKDLVVVVRSSNLTVKAELADALSEFSSDTRMAARGLQRLSARINGAVDSISSFNAYAFQHISSMNRGSPREVGTMVLCTFRSSMNGFSTQITRVMVEATTTMSSLDLLEDRLSVIYQLYIHESFETTLALDSLLWDLWTILGGNQEKLRDLQTRAVVLKDVERYRAVAVAYVAATSQTLLAVDTELSELRDRLTGYVVDSQDIPVEVHLASIERSISRLHEKFQMRRGIDPA